MTRPRIPPKKWVKVSFCCPACGNDVFALKMGHENVFTKIACGHCLFRYDIVRDEARCNPNQATMPLHQFTEFLLRDRNGKVGAP